MRFGTWRGVARRLAFALATAIATGVVATAPAPAWAGSFFPSYPHTIPREVTAIDVNTGGPYFAPPIPNGCYAKDHLGAIADGIGLVHGCLSSLLHGCCQGCHGSGCNLCGGSGKCGHCRHCSGSGLFHHGDDPSGDAGQECDSGGWRGLLHGHDNGHGLGLGQGHGHGNDWEVPGIACGNGGGICGSKQTNSCGSLGHALTVCASMQAVAPPPMVSPQGVSASSQMGCNQPGCKLNMRHFHRMGKGCNACNGNGCGNCQGDGMSSGTLCSACGGSGTRCGLCGGTGLLHHGKNRGHGGDPCSACGGKGCGLCGGTGLCGTGLCSKLLGVPAGVIGKLLHIGDIEYFVGPGGPVPITPGYVPYVVTTRSPRDYFAFPPFSDVDP